MKKKSYKTLEKELKLANQTLQDEKSISYNLKNFNYNLEKKVSELKQNVEDVNAELFRQLKQLKGEQAGVLLEIIRWQCNPETAKTPFKGQGYHPDNDIASMFGSTGKC